MNFGRAARWAGFGVLAIAILLISGWCALALWFRCNLGQPARSLVAAAPVILGLVTVGSFAVRQRWRVFAVNATLTTLILGWWVTIKPASNRDWAPEIARTASAAIDGDRLVITGVRNFAWRSDTDFDQRWEQRRYNLSHLSDVDLIMSYWAGEAIAHTIVSFGFTDGPRLAFSIETRKQRDEAYSSVAGFFKQYELAIVVADERDVVRVRSNIRGEDVRIYRLRMPPAAARLLLLRYVSEINDIARAPRFYNTLTTNCTTLVFDMVRAIRPGLPWDPRILLSGYLPNYVYDLGATTTSIPFEQLLSRSRIWDRAARANEDLDFSAQIREGIPTPYCVRRAGRDSE